MRSLNFYLEEKIMKKALPIIVYTLVLVLVTGLISSGATLLIASAVRLGSGDTVTISQDEYALLQKYGKLDNILNLIKTVYVDDVSDEALIENAAYGMVALLEDPYSFYMDTESMEAMEESDSGQYVGIGATFTTDPDSGMMVLTRIYPDSPASESGLQVGDQLYAVNGENIVGMPTTDVTALVRGEEGTELTMTVLRGEEKTEQSYTMTRRKVDVVDVEYRLLDDGVLHITLSSFSTNADKAFKEAIEYGRKNGATGILLDLRGNGGGADNILQPIADLLLPEGLIFYTEDRSGNRNEYKSDAYNIGLPMVVLCDENSASASEVLIASLQDYGAATIVGATTFGKAVGQSTYTVDADGSGVHITTVRVYSPLGRNWHGEGLEPDIVVEQPDELKNNPLLCNDDNDVQYIEGLKVLRDMIPVQ